MSRAVRLPLCLAILLLLLLLFLSTAAAAQPIAGTWSLVTDSDGTRPKQGMIVTLVLSESGAAQLAARDTTGGNPPFDAAGPYVAHDGLISITLPELEIKLTNRPYTLDDNTLVLPFKVFNEGAGTSTWKRAGTDMAGGGGSRPPEPPEPPEDKKTPLPPPPPPPEKVGGGRGDAIVCTCDDKTYDTPARALRNCTQQRLGRPMCGAVITIKQLCAEFQNKDGYRREYERIALGRSVGTPGMALGMATAGAMTGVGGHESLVALTINTFFAPWTARDYIISVTPGKPEDAEYAKVLYAGVRSKLIVRGSAFNELSPAGFVAKIGHEMVHGEQMQRKYPGVYFGQINDAKDAMNELEASSWETNKTAFAWKVRSNKMWDCQRPEERDFASVVRSCREWQVREALVRINREPDAQSNFDKWVNLNPWARVHWLPKNRTWKQVTRNDAPNEIPFPTDRNKRVRCDQLFVAPEQQ